VENIAGFAAVGQLPQAMPILLNRTVFEPEAIRIMSVVLESVCAELGLCDKDDSATRLVASKIIEFRAERRPGRCTAAVDDTHGASTYVKPVAACC
jgi:hypothetical protein